MSPVDELMRAAEAALRDGQLEECESLCGRILEGDPNHLPALVLRGIVAAREQRFETANALLSRALALAPDLFEALLWLGIAQKAQGLRREATSTLRQALRVWPGNPSALSELGDLFLTDRKGAKAAACYQEAIASRPNDAALHHNLAASLHQAGDLEAAERAYREALRLEPTSTSTLVNLGQLLLEMGRNSEGAELFRKAYAAEPETARGLVQLARAQREAGELDQAEASLREALRLEPESVEALEAVSNLLQQLGQFDEAATLLDRAIALDSGRSRLHFNRAYCRKSSDDDRPALDRMKETLKTAGLSAQDRRYLHYALGKAYNDLGEPEPAMRYFDEANRAMRELMRFRPFERDIHTAEFNRKIASWTPDSFDPALGDPSPLPVLIVGMIRSGTTLVEQILSSHPQIGGGGELPFWIRNAHELDPRQGPPSREKVRRVAHEYLEHLSTLAPGMERVTDKMPHNYMHLGPIHLALPNARIVHCRRHPVDNCLSIYMTPYHSPLDFAHDRENIVFVYREYERLMDHWRKVLPADRFLEVDYEALANDPEPVVRRMVDFVGLPWDDACLRPELNRRAVKTPSMWQVRQPVYKTSTERWRKYEPWLGAFAELAPRVNGS